MCVDVEVILLQLVERHVVSSSIILDERIVGVVDGENCWSLVSLQLERKLRPIVVPFHSDELHLNVGVNFFVLLGFSLGRSVLAPLPVLDFDRLAIVDKMEEQQLLDGVTMISLRDQDEINFLYEGRVSVLLGTSNNLDYKMRMAANVILDVDGKGLTPTDHGTLDVSYQRSDGDIVAYFLPADPTPTPTPTPETDTNSGDGGETGDSGDTAGDDGGDASSASNDGGDTGDA